MKLQLRSEFFNMLNHPNFRISMHLAAGAYTAAQPARQIQFALKFLFYTGQGTGRNACPTCTIQK
jgi:hypothetical protein